MSKAIIIGNGSIGSELQKQIKDLGWQIEKVVTRETPWRELSADVVFLAIPTDNGEKALEYIEHFLGKNIPVVTCEKGALSNYFEKLSHRLNLLGVSATVGGGARMIPYLRGRIQEKIDSVTGVLNGTLNFIFSKLSEGVPQTEVLKEVLDKKYAEPGANTFEEIIRGELGDLHKKTIILANLSGLLDNALVLSQDFVIDKVSLDRALAEPARYRFIFSMNKSAQNFLAGVHYESDPWHIQAGIFDITNMKIDLPEGVNNALFIKEGESVYSVSGPGAGPFPTALSMIADAKEMLK